MEESYLPSLAAKGNLGSGLRRRGDLHHFYHDDLYHDASRPDTHNYSRSFTSETPATERASS